jgi:hypothetical protein
LRTNYGGDFSKVADGPPAVLGESVLTETRKEAAMWRGGSTDWIVLASGYVLALGLFYWLGGIKRAGDAIRSWGRSSTRDVRHRSL